MKPEACIAASTGNNNTATQDTVKSSMKNRGTI
jgi:hypothetical protein